jgi:hypothetical protein
MDEAGRNSRNQSRFLELYPTFRVRVEKVIESLEKRGLRPRIQSAWRSPEDQKKAYDAGHSKLLYGFHNVSSKANSPEALAVDLLDDDNPLNSSSAYILQLAAAAEDAGLMTGIRWGLPKALVGAVDKAIADKNWGVKIKLGWDPTHIQPIDITVAEAKKGKRPA